jgi:hypothetical protein
MKFGIHMGSINSPLYVFFLYFAKWSLKYRMLKKHSSWGRKTICMLFFIINFFGNAFRETYRADCKAYEIFFVAMYKRTLNL